MTATQRVPQPHDSEIVRWVGKRQENKPDGIFSNDSLLGLHVHVQ